MSSRGMQPYRHLLWSIVASVHTDVALDSHTAPTKLFTTIKASKTDPFCQGVAITLGKTGRHLCPMTSILPYIAQWGSQLDVVYTQC